MPRCPLKGGARDQAAAEEIGQNPTDRGKPGSKRHVLVDRQGTPLAIWLTPASVHDGQLLTALVDAVEPIYRPRGQAGRPRKRPNMLHAGKAYSSRANRGGCASAASRHGSPDWASSRVSGWGATAGWSNGRWPGWAASADWPSATSGGPTSTWPSWISAVPCCASPPSSTSDAARRSQFVIELAASA